LQLNHSGIFIIRHPDDNLEKELESGLGIRYSLHGTVVLKYTIGVCKTLAYAEFSPHTSNRFALNSQFI
jgi:hypothetical protein